MEEEADEQARPAPPLPYLVVPCSIIISVAGFMKCVVDVLRVCLCLWVRYFRLLGGVYVPLLSSFDH